jgi:hypothetical protein
MDMQLRRLLSATGANTIALVVSGTFGVAGVASATTSTASGAPMIRPHRNAASPGIPTVSENWSGYAATGKTFTSVQSVFVQPVVKCPGAADQWTSNWVGLDGFNDSTVEQDGTSVECGGPGHTTPVYEAWYEMYPANSKNVFRVNPGDVIQTSVSYSGGLFTLTVSDVTTGLSKTHSATCSKCARSSAEWIIERPALCSSATKCFLTALANFGTSTMSDDLASAQGGTSAPISSFTSSPINMIDPLTRGFISLDTVGPLVKAGNSFTVTWDRSGKITPISL